MALTDKPKTVIENDFNEKGWNSYAKSGRSIGVLSVPAWQFITWSKKSRRLGRQSVVKEAAHPLPQQQKKTGRFLRSLFVRKKMNLVSTIPSGKSHLGYRSANHQFIAWPRKRIFFATNVYKHPWWTQHAVREEPNVLESFFNVFQSFLYHGSCFKMRRTFSFKYQLIAKTIEFISMVPRKMCNENAYTWRKQNFKKGYGIRCDNLERC